MPCHCLTVYSESPFAPPAESAKLSEILFETFSAPALYSGKSAALASFSVGRPTSLVVDVGASEARVIPVVDGFCIFGAAQRNHVAGGIATTDALVDELSSLLY